MEEHVKKEYCKKTIEGQFGYMYLISVGIDTYPHQRNYFFSCFKLIVSL